MDDADRCTQCGHLPGCDCPHQCTPAGADPLALLDAEVEQANRDHFFRLAAGSFAVGDTEAGLYFLDAADTYAEPSPAQASARLVMLLGAIGAVSERPEGAEL